MARFDSGQDICMASQPHHTFKTLPKALKTEDPDVVHSQLIAALADPWEVGEIEFRDNSHIERDRRPLANFPAPLVATTVTNPDTDAFIRVDPYDHRPAGWEDPLFLGQRVLAAQPDTDTEPQYLTAPNPTHPDINQCDVVPTESHAELIARTARSTVHTLPDEVKQNDAEQPIYNRPPYVIPEPINALRTAVAAANEHAKDESIQSEQVSFKRFC
ncbi:hypothetical protein RYH80_18360 [Halobaculum sp. MBLA0147]|uniref:hypothetical protein n=1 Tax=Halobaculum sp. MBLA0147 TaxID=3079934 RepID=UPI0035240E53